MKYQSGISTFYLTVLFILPAEAEWQGLILCNEPHKIFFYYIKAEMKHLVCLDTKQSEFCCSNTPLCATCCHHKNLFYQLISCSRIFLMKLIILYSLWRNILPVIIPKLSLPCAQELAIQPYPEPDKYNPQLHTLLFKDLFDYYSSVHAHVSKSGFHLQVLWQHFFVHFGYLLCIQTFLTHHILIYTIILKISSKGICY